MKTDTESLLVEFLNKLIRTRVADKRLLRLNRNQVLSEIEQFMKEQSEDREDPLLLFESWEPLLRKPVLASEFSVQYNPFTEELVVQWVPSWNNVEWAAEIMNQNLTYELSERIKALSPFEFENLMQQMFSRVSWARDLRVTGRSGDGGIDFEGTFVAQDSGLKSSLFGQAKHWKSKVGSEPIRTFIGSVTVKAGNRKAIGVYVCTAGFSSEAEEAINKSPFTIIKFDLHRMVDEMIQNGIGVSNVKVLGRKLDARFWDELET